MRVNNFKIPKSSFLSVDKDMATIINLFLKNQRLTRLLYRTGNNPMAADMLTEEETVKLLEDKWIRNVPKIQVDPNVVNYIVISFDNFLPSGNPEFRDNVIIINIICHYDQWNIANGQLRPYRIAGEIDSMLDGQRLSGIGKLEFIGCRQIGADNDIMGGLSLVYSATHGEDDKKGFENPADEEQFLEEFADGIKELVP